jgi:EmrB/QacA subfamily drug resistance transporter
MMRDAAGPKAGAEAGAHPRRWWALVVLGSSLLALTVQDTIVTVALPTLARELSASASQLQWIVEAYILALAGLVIPFGVLSDRYGRRLSFVVGLVVFGAASLAGAIAPSAGWLIASRVAMGVGAALVMPSTLSIIRAIFPAEERKTAIAVWGGIAALGVVVGPLAGGWLLENFSWGSVFLVNVPITVAAVLGAIFLVPESRHPSSVPLDLAGAGLAIAAMCAVTFGITEAPSLGWSDPLTLGPLAVGALPIGAFVLREWRTPHPMIDLRLFANRRFSAAILSVALAYSVLFGIFFIVTQYLQFVLGYGPLTAGLELAPLVVTIVPASFLGARLASRLGDGATISGGLLVAAAGLAVLSFATPSTGYALLAAFVVIGLGIGAVGTVATDSVMDSVPEEKAGGAAAINEMAMQLGGALGIAALGSALSVGYARAFGGASGGAEGVAGGPAAAAAESIGAAARVAADLGGAAGEGILDLARSAFVGAMAPTSPASSRQVARQYTCRASSYKRGALCGFGSP